MRKLTMFVPVLFTLVCALSSAQSQTSAASAKTSVVPSLVKYSGVAKDLNSNPISGVVGMTFALYQNQQGGAPVWVETQSVTPDKSGHYTVSLGATKAQGIPAEVFATGEAQWLGVQIEGQPEQARVFLVSVPYALKAADAETIGGLRPSAFVLAAPASVGKTNGSSGTTAAATSDSIPPPAVSNVTTTGGTVNVIPLFTTSTNVQNSILTQVGTTAVNVFGKLNLPATGAATATGGKNSRPEAMVSSAFNSSTAAAVNQIFQLQAEPAGNNTATPSGTLNVLYGSGTAVPTETGLKISSKGVLTFAAGQTFPGTGNGTITGITADSGLVGGGTTGNVTLGMIKTCASGQVLQWNGTTWVCANTSGGGTITGVTAGTDLTGGGTTGSITLNLNTAALQIANDARYAQLNTANTFTQPFIVGTSGGTGIAASALNIGLQGSSAVTGVYGSTSGSGGSPVGVLGASANATAVRGNDSGSGTGVVGTSITGFAVYGTSNGSSGLPANIAAVSGDSSSVPGVWGNSAGADGVHGVNGSGAAGASGQNNGGGFGVFGYATGTSGQGVWGESLATGIAHGIGADGVHGMTHTTNGAGVSGGNDAAGGIGVYGYATNSGFGFGTNSNVQQARGMSGWVKAIAYVDPFATGGIAITRCFNSQQSGAAVYTPPCGITIVSHIIGQNILDFGFEVDDRFNSATVHSALVGIDTFTSSDTSAVNINQILVDTYYTYTNSNAGTDARFTILIY